jgi:hypothetical protein
LVMRGCVETVEDDMMTRIHTRLAFLFEQKVCIKKKTRECLSVKESVLKFCHLF